MQNPLLYTIIGLLLACTTFLSNVIFRAGQHSQRITELENWRSRVHNDLHEFSQILTKMTAEMGRLATLIEERTDRRYSVRNRNEPSSNT